MKKLIKEVEVKAKLKNPTRVVKKLKALGCVLSSPIQQDDYIYIPNFRKSDPTTIPAGGIALRIRKQNDKILFTFKKALTNQLDCLEYELEIKNSDQMDAIIKELGFYLFSQVHKKRIKTTHKSYEICIDEVEGLGSFIEVEHLTTDNSTDVQKTLMQFLTTLGISENDQVYEGYDILLAKQALQNAS